MKFRTQEKYTVKDCLSNPNSLYVFGDNLMRYGKKGQAIIRNCPNAFGIATKYSPSMNESAFFYDAEIEKMLMVNEFIRLKEFIETSNYDFIVFPTYGIGTGLAKLPQKSPLIHKLILKNIETIKKEEK